MLDSLHYITVQNAFSVVFFVITHDIWGSVTVLNNNAHNQERYIQENLKDRLTNSFLKLFHSLCFVRQCFPVKLQLIVTLKGHLTSQH